jgi:hypothetical protein
MIIKRFHINNKILIDKTIMVLLINGIYSSFIKRLSFKCKFMRSIILFSNLMHNKFGLARHQWYFFLINFNIFHSVLKAFNDRFATLVIEIHTKISIEWSKISFEFFITNRFFKLLFVGTNVLEDKFIDRDVSFERLEMEGLSVGYWCINGNCQCFIL